MKTRSLPFCRYHEVKYHPNIMLWNKSIYPHSSIGLKYLGINLYPYRIKSPFPEIKQYGSISIIDKFRINLFSILAQLRGPIVRPSRARFDPRVAINWLALFWSQYNHKWTTERNCTLSNMPVSMLEVINDETELTSQETETRGRPDDVLCNSLWLLLES